MATDQYLLQSLNKRLDTSIWNLNDMRAYLRQLKKRGD